ncbi:MAG: cobalamin-binding protein [bacterium]
MLKGVFKGLLRGFCVVLMGLSHAHGKSIVITDDTGVTINLEAPAQRIVTLAPHLAEQVYSAGGGDRLVGVVTFSNFPKAVENLPVIGSYDKVNYEAIIALQPDLILAWKSGNGEEMISRLRRLGLNVYVDESVVLPDVGRTIRQIGILVGQPDFANGIAEKFLREYQALQDRYADARKLSVFYQLWNDPLLTINSKHIIADVIGLCGGYSIFEDAIPLVPKVNLETVVRRNPDVIIASGMGAERPEWLNDWKKWPAMKAVERGALFSIHPDYLHRHTLRLLDGAHRICAQLEQVRRQSDD